MQKVKIEVCCGTACYLLGAANLMKLEDNLPENLKGRIDVQARPCLELCERDNLAGAPYVRINDIEIMSNANVEKVVKRLTELVEGIS
jgi:NADH:ubiquinone oxidoreductase subunit E